jgi:sortase (surface protein transpeptidase)
MSENRRSKKYKQKIIRCNVLKLREIEFRIVDSKATNRTNESIQKISKLRRVPLSSLSLIVVGLIGVFYFTGHAYGQPFLAPQAITTPYQPSVEAAVPQDISETDAKISYNPKSLSIPSVNVANSVTDVGLNTDGSLQTPELFEDKIGWYKNSKKPGQIGTSVYVGHVDTYKGPSVLSRLHQASVGEKIQVVDSEGNEFTYIIDAIEQYRQDSFPSEKVYADTVDSSLRIITCSGMFDHSAQRYSHNTVVYASILEK